MFTFASMCFCVTYLLDIWQIWRIIRVTPTKSPLHGWKRPSSLGLAQDPLARPARTQRKPVWVIDALVRLKVHLPDAGCRTLANSFNRLHAPRESVSKSFVAGVLRSERYRILRERRALRRRAPNSHSCNAVWGIDLTGKLDTTGALRTILGIVDHGSRRVLSLTEIANKSAWTLIGQLCITIGQFGKPGAVRTDNEHCFTGWVFSGALRLCGIKHQKIDLGCPWQNGRVERFFGTLKGKLNRWTVASSGSLQGVLNEFAIWYNVVRPHQNLGGRTPLEVWHGVSVEDCFGRTSEPRDVVWVTAWDGLLGGFYIRRRE